MPYQSLNGMAVTYPIFTWKRSANGIFGSVADGQEYSMFYEVSTFGSMSYPRVLQHAFQLDFMFTLVWRDRRIYDANASRIAEALTPSLLARCAH